MATSVKLLVKAILIAGTAIYLIIWGLFYLSSLVTFLLGLPTHLNMQLTMQLLGGAVLFSGVGLVLWLLKYRNPATMIISTYFTFVNMFTRTSISQVGGRFEPLVVSGPLKYIRHPLYLGAAVSFLGWGMLIGSTSMLIGVLFVFLWFRFVQIPFEEKELRTIFGERYDKYSKEVPMLIPFTKKKTKVKR